jgi:hypothetical protein
MPYEELSGIILPTQRICLYRARGSLETGLTSGDFRIAAPAPIGIGARMKFSRACAEMS